MKKNIFISIGGLSLIALAISSYIMISGHLSLRASVTSIYDFSRVLVTQWQTISGRLSIPVGATEKGALSPIINEKYSALDLAIYGAEIVDPYYKEEFSKASVTPLTDRLFITSNSEGKILYNVGGVQLVSIRDAGNNSVAAFYLDVPFALIQEASKRYDSHIATSDADNVGIIRYDKLDDGRYVMGVYIIL